MVMRMVSFPRLSRLFASFVVGIVCCGGISRAEAPVNTPAAANTRHGFFNLLDSRSKYGTNWFPEPLNTDEMDADQEVRFNYFHAERKGFQADEVSAEVEKSFELLTIELEVPYEREVEVEDGERNRAEGIGSIELSARHPVFQYVSDDGFFDYTFGAR